MVGLHTEGADGPRPARAWYTVCVLMLGYVVAFVDRQVLSLLVEPIKTSLGLKDSQLGLLQGFAFATFYTLLGLPIARWVDSSSRRNLVAMGVTLWTLMTAACGLARNYWELLLARCGVGVGEATLAPAAISMISDSFPPERRAGQAEIEIHALRASRHAPDREASTHQLHCPIHIDRVLTFEARKLLDQPPCMAGSQLSEHRLLELCKHGGSPSDALVSSDESADPPTATQGPDPDKDWS